MKKVEADTENNSPVSLMPGLVKICALLGSGGMFHFYFDKFYSYEEVDYHLLFSLISFGGVIGAISGFFIWVLIVLIIPAIYRLICQLNFKLIAITAILTVVTSAAGALLSPVVAVIGALVGLFFGLNLEEDPDVSYISFFPFLFFASAFLIINISNFWTSFFIALLIVFLGSAVAQIVDKFAEWVDYNPAVGYFLVAAIFICSGLAYLAYVFSIMP